MRVLLHPCALVHTLAMEIQKDKLQAVQDQFIEGVQNDYIQEQLLQEGPETL